MKSLLAKNKKQRLDSQPANEATGPISALRDNDAPNKIKVADQLYHEEASYFTSDLAEYQANLEAIGPAIDDEESASYMTPLVQVTDEAMSIRAGSKKRITQLFLSSDTTMPKHDPESHELIFASTGPAVDEMTTAQYASSFFA
ncbi:MAG: hypothetical protein KDI79_11475 [Anaerolineae bacterium]|nr:hypothetical protein [Anaerolineae bacterium]